MPQINKEPVFITLVAVVMVVLVGVCIYFAAKDQSEWEDWCRSQGGRVDKDSNTSTVTTYDSKGQPSFGTTTSTTYYCLTDDGRILDVK